MYYVLFLTKKRVEIHFWQFLLTHVVTLAHWALNMNVVPCLHRRALDARDAQGHPAVVDLVVGVVLQEGVGDLGQAEPFLAIHDQGDDPDAIQNDGTDLEPIL
jgi:hypothetical protein